MFILCPFTTNGKYSIFGLFEFEVMPFGLSSETVGTLLVLTSMTLQLQPQLGGTSESSPSGLQLITVGGSHNETKEVPIWWPGGVLPWSCRRCWEAPAQSKESASSKRLSSTSDQEGRTSLPRTCGLLQTFHPSLCHSCCAVDRFAIQQSNHTPRYLWKVSAACLPWLKHFR